MTWEQECHLHSVIIIRVSRINNRVLEVNEIVHRLMSLHVSESLRVQVVPVLCALARRRIVIKA